MCISPSWLVSKLRFLFPIQKMMISHGPPMPTDIDFFPFVFSAGDLISIASTCFLIPYSFAEDHFGESHAILYGAKTLSDPNPRHFWFQFGDLRCETFFFLACMVSLNTVCVLHWMKIPSIQSWCHGMDRFVEVSHRKIICYHSIVMGISP